MDFSSEIAAESAFRTPYCNSTLLPLLLLSLALDKNSPNTKVTFRDVYDYIIIGGGSAGATLAGRLAEVPCVSVLLLEAGKAPPKLTDVPAFAPTYYGTEVDWKFELVPQKFAAQGYPGKIIRYIRGKMLGGTSCINDNQYVRGNKLDYDRWAAGGAEGWSYEEVLPFFKKSEGNQIPELIDDDYHGDRGPITVTEDDYISEITDSLFKAYQEFRVPRNPDINGRLESGVHVGPQTIRNGQRCSTAKAYLVPQENATNLDIVTEAFVTKVVIKNQRATGVMFDFKGQSFEVKARREVIVSAGSINTPKILMLSGLGLAEELNKHNIPIVSELPVGLNLHDHFSIAVPFELDGRIKALGVKLKNEEYLKEYIERRTGPLTINRVDRVVSLVNKEFSNIGRDYPSIQLYFLSAQATAVKSIFVKEIYDQVYAPYENKTIATCLPIILRTKTRGSIKLRSSDPYDPPIIDIQYLKEPSDMDLLVEGIKLCQKIITSETMKSVRAKPLTTRFPGCERLFCNEDKYFRCMAELIATQSNHQGGTAKMGSKNDPTTVVDPQLRVKNIQNLRVVDASVMPEIPRGNTNNPTIMIAEKAADMIKETIPYC